ncbi:VOC family protein [Mycobacterium sp.]|uniref:VOC family protein n=1 Tax=Mycobacterium sp. TaxID=1785 RepID=UPI0025DCA788|nr:VOC family protein [Mycobacterium sp.]MBW0011686.1 VOC family protein [Mycobacterium sp.]
MTSSVFAEASAVMTIMRVRDVAASIEWYRDNLGLDPVHVGADGAEHPFAVYSIAGSTVSLWQLPPGESRVREDNDRNSYVAVLMNGDLESPRRQLLSLGVKVGDIHRSANNEFVWFYDPDGNRF